MCYAGTFGYPPWLATREKAQLMSASEIDRTLVRLAHEILEKTEDLDQLAFIGIRRRGVPLAQRLATKSRRWKSARFPSAFWTSISIATIFPPCPRSRCTTLPRSTFR